MRTHQEKKARVSRKRGGGCQRDRAVHDRLEEAVDIGRRVAAYGCGEVRRGDDAAEHPQRLVVGLHGPGALALHGAGQEVFRDRVVQGLLGGGARRAPGSPSRPPSGTTMDALVGREVKRIRPCGNGAARLPDESDLAGREPSRPRIAVARRRGARATPSGEGWWALRDSNPGPTD